MIRGKRISVFILTVVCIICAAFAAGCAKDEKKYYTVTFLDGDAVYERVEVERGKRLELPAAPQKEDEDYVFDGWYYDESAQKPWNVETDRVTQNLILWANYLIVSALPGNISMGRTAFSSEVVWLQRAISPQTVFQISLYEGIRISETEFVYSETPSESYSDLSGESGKLTLTPYLNREGVYEVRWTPSAPPQGGVYAVAISCEAGASKKDALQFKGAGTPENPYLLTDAEDLSAINSADVAGGRYKIEKSFSVKLFAQNILGHTFNGTLDGNGKTVTIDAGGCGLFGTLGEQALIEDLTVDGSIAETSANCVGVIASVNNGTVDYCTVSAGIESAIGEVGKLVGDKNSIVGGAAGIAGVNNGMITNSVYSGSARAKAGAGGFAVINNGEIVNCTYSGTLGAGNAIESSDSTNAMSYMGGIAAVNYGKISLCAATGRLLAQRSRTGGGSNDNIGGIAAFNTAEGVIERCYTGSMRVYGNRNVGGIAGENSGAVSYCYVTAAYRSNITSHNYIGGTANVGGIAGLSHEGATVTNCYVTANVYAYDGAAYKVAQSCENCVYLGGNLDDRDFTIIKNNEKESTKASPLIFPEGGDNIQIGLTDEIKEEYKTKTYTLTLDDAQFEVLSGGGRYYKSKNDLTFQTVSNVKDREIEVILVVNGEEIAYGSVGKVSGNKIIPSAPDTADSYVAGYALVEGGSKPVFAAGDAIGYAELEIFNRDTVTLYPVYIKGAKPESKLLSVAVWTRYVEIETVAKLLNAYENSQYFLADFEIQYEELSSKNNDGFKTDYESGNFNVAFGFKSTAVDKWQSEIVQIYIYNVYDQAYGTLKVGLNSSDTVVANFGLFLESDEAKKIMNPEYVEVSLYCGDEKTGTEFVASNESLNLPSPEAEEGFVFAGWSVNREAEEGETLYSGTVSYADLAAIAQGKELTLYVRFRRGEQTDPDTVLQVAVFQNSAFDPQIAVQLVEAFKIYCNEREIECNEAKSVLLTEAKYADFTAAAINGGYHIAIGFQANDFTKVHGIPAENIKDIRLSSSSTRRVALLASDAPLAVEFYQFVESDTAKKIMNPDYVSQTDAIKIEIVLMNGETQYGDKLYVSNATEAEPVTLPVLAEQEGMSFLGWALTAESLEGETYFSGEVEHGDIEDYSQDGKLLLYARFTREEQRAVLKVAVYKKFIDQPVVDALKAAFEKYCLDNAISYGELQFDLITTGNGAAFTADASEYDVALGHKGGTDFKPIASQTVAMMMNEENGGTVANDRKADRLTDSDLAKAFMDFLTTDEGKAALVAVSE